MSVLSINSLTLRYGLFEAVHSASLSINDGEVVALVGANGAGKTTLLRGIAGAHQTASGQVYFAGKDVTGTTAHERVRRGIALVPEGRRLFPNLTVEENIRVAESGGTGPWALETVLDALPLLKPLRKRRAGALSGGEQQATAIARALVTNPQLLLVDELSLGLAPVAVNLVYESLRTVIDGGVSILLVDQDLTRAMSVSQRVVCMLEGRLVLEGKASELTREQITEAYFGLRDRGTTAA